jgi:RNA polymerase sigma-70 factor, ECF subfamily
VSLASTLRHETPQVPASPGRRERAVRPDFAAAAEDNLDAVFRYLAHLVHDRDLAEDLTSATFERALRDWHRFDPARGRASVWLIEIARRIALDHLRSERRRRARERRYAARTPEAVDPVEPGGLSPGMRQALGRLTRAERELVALRVVLGLDAAQTARVVGGSPASVGAGLHRALTMLRREVRRS